MSLIIICGIPSSGKTTRAKQITQYFLNRFSTQEKIGNVHLINDESLGITKDSYRDTRVEEKKARASLISAIERLVSKEDVVIADGINYIKGYRYQLYCIARAVGTPHCVIYELVSRFEEPDDRNRSLFTVLYDDPVPSYDGIWDAIIVKKAKPPNLSTVAKPVSETNYLYELEKTTQDIINAVLNVQKNDVGANSVTIPNTTKTIKLPSRTITLSELRRLRMQFTNINKMHTLDVDRVAELFVEYLNTNINR
ncbi:chromatin associated protein KTI12-domain-containing protein [Gigaspora rosea]|uniref:Chromatin associated protein KTI12-domain-containing protein n=1 Tax=Gigaspora rosea TaxID=44941 RepID=A0A397TQ67_9GLOM|nr:chromatin associated protein KTI12-domain-containing protein [Gigaspora rosea]